MFSFKSALTNKDPEHTAAVKKEIQNALGEISSHLHSTFLDGKDQGIQFHQHSSTFRYSYIYCSENKFLSIYYFCLFVGESPSMLDFMVYPMTEKLFAAISKPLRTFQDDIDLIKFPKVKKWMEALQETPAFQAANIPLEKIATYYESVEQGRPQYDF